MRYCLVVFLCAISFSASAQWWRLRFKKHPVLPLLNSSKIHSVKSIKKHTFLLANQPVQPVILEASDFSLQIKEAMVLRTAKHNMRFRVYNEASYNFSDLAALYIKLHRYSEAKWYLLQSNAISREENDDRHTIANLVSLAMVKTNLGDVPSARADLLEARDLAHAKGMQTDAGDIDKKIQMIDQGKITAPAKVEFKYAENTETDKKAL